MWLEFRRVLFRSLLAESVDFNEVKKELAEKIGYEPKQDEVLSYLDRKSVV